LPRKVERFDRLDDGELGRDNTLAYAVFVPLRYLQRGEVPEVGDAFVLSLSESFVLAEHGWKAKGSELVFDEWGAHHYCSLISLVAYC
jgi:hypothetical protein